VVVQPPGGEPYVIGNGVDITDLKRAEQTLKESEERYRNLFESAPAFICQHQMDGTIISLNPVAARALGYTPSELTGHNIREFLAPASVAKLDGSRTTSLAFS
jgi:two-component system sensor histidine kinase VicK